jgi:hypothetical protein
MKNPIARAMGFFISYVMQLRQVLAFQTTMMGSGSHPREITLKKYVLH